MYSQTKIHSSIAMDYSWNNWDKKQKIEKDINFWPFGYIEDTGSRKILGHIHKNIFYKTIILFFSIVAQEIFASWLFLIL